MQLHLPFMQQAQCDEVQTETQHEASMRCAFCAAVAALACRPAYAFITASTVHTFRQTKQHVLASTSVAAPTAAELEFLDTAGPSLSVAEVLYFERNGHSLTRNLFSAAEIEQLAPSIISGFEQLELGALQQKVAVLLGEDAAPSDATAEDLLELLQQLPPEDIPFLQVFNMWRTPGPHEEAVKRVVLSKRLAKHAADLLGVSAVRVYQDSTFVKRCGDGPTNWHSDLNMAPFDTNDMVTAWLPLMPVASYEEGGSGLIFASRSHRDFAINYWADPHAQEDLSER
jgi:hypothetical protein